MSNSLKAALWTSAFTFVGTLSITLFGWLSAVAEWAGTDGAEFPSVTPLGKAAAAAVVATASGLLNWAVRYIQQKRDPLSGPHYGAN
jgi:hypothetical protein